MNVEEEHVEYVVIGRFIARDQLRNLEAGAAVRTFGHKNIETGCAVCDNRLQLDNLPGVLTLKSTVLLADLVRCSVAYRCGKRSAVGIRRVYRKGL